MSLRYIRRLGWPLLLCYPPLALLGAWTHQPDLYVGALACLVAGLGVLLVAPHRRVASWVWLVLAMAAGIAVAAGHALVALDVMPILANLALAWLFGHTLRPGSRPLVARLVVVVESEARLKIPDVARYTRQVTWFWTLLLLTQALVASVLLVCAVPGGMLASLGLSSPLPLSQAWAAGYMHLGAWLVPVLGMIMEYLFRRWHLRHLPHVGVRQFVLRLITCWPRLIRSIVAP